MGFTRDKRLHRYYMSNQDAFRLKLMLPYREADAVALGLSPGGGEGVEELTAAVAAAGVGDAGGKRARE